MGNITFFKYLIVVVFLLLPQVVFSQLMQPAQWSELVNDPVRNSFRRDTFLFQSFEYNRFDNWNYKDTGNIKSFLFNIKFEGWPGQGGDNSLCLSGGSEVLFTIPNNGEFKDVQVSFIVGANPSDHSKFEFFTTYRDATDQYSYILCKNSNPIFYRSKFLLNEKTEVDHITVKNDPVSLRMKVTEGINKGFFYIDSLLAYGDRYDYSLFTGAGLWDTSACWSHGPVQSKRSAFISGDVLYSANKPTIETKQISICEGSLSVAENTRIEMDSLFLWGDKAFVYTKGEVAINTHLSFIKTFPEKGAWYFFSLPFDLYLDGLDKRFKLGDDKTTGEGNYIYLSTYDTEKRATYKQTKDNWKVIPANYPADRPLIEKGKGYLIAVDTGAETSQLYFSAYLDEPVLYDSQDVYIDLNPGVFNEGKDPEHYGWLLCGNPFLSPICITQINAHADRNASIYIFNGNGYKAYTTKNEVTIPPLSAFFVKVSHPMQLQIKNTGEPVTSPFAVTDSPLRMEMNDPVGVFQTDLKEALVDNSVIKSVRDGIVSIESPDEKANLSVISLSGKIVYRTSIPKGRSTILLPVSQGIYILHIKGTSYQAQDKFVINQ